MQLYLQWCLCFLWQSQARVRVYRGLSGPLYVVAGNCTDCISLLDGMSSCTEDTGILWLAKKCFLAFSRDHSE